MKIVDCFFSFQDDFHDIQISSNATRVYCILLAFSFTILICYSSFTIRSVTISLEVTSAAALDEIFTRDLSSLDCPCSQAVIPYKEILSVSMPRFHQVSIRLTKAKCDDYPIERILVRWNNTLFYSFTSYNRIVYIQLIHLYAQPEQREGREQTERKEI